MYNPNELTNIAKGLFGKLINQGYNAITIHQYTDTQGNTIYAKARLKNTQGKKHIRPFFFDMDNQWKMGEPVFTPNQKPLYYLHKLSQAQSIWIFEGEQKADLMDNLGYIATTTGGSNTITAHDLQPLAGKECVLWRDNDTAGISWLDTFIQALQALSPPPTIHIVDVDKLGLVEKGDIVDYMQGCDITTMHAKLQALPMLDNNRLQQLLQATSTAKPAQNSQPATATPAPKQDEPWGEPLPLDDKYHKENDYPLDSFGSELADVITQIAYYAQVPLAVAGQSVLGVLSAIGQRMANAPFLNTHIPASLFLITEFPSGQGKSQATKLANYELAEWERENYLNYLAVLNEWERLPPKDRATNPKPKSYTYMVSDGTIEAVTDKFILDEQKDVYWNTDEAGQFFNGYSMKSDTAGSSISSLTKLWDGSPVSKIRSQRGKTGQDRTNAYDARLTLDVMGQRVILEPAMTDPVLINQGFLPRALLACPKSFQGYRQYNTPDRMNASPSQDWHLTKYYQKCRELLIDKPIERVNMPFKDDTAKQALADYMQDVETKQRTGEPYAQIPAFAGRMGENTARIACLLALFQGEKAVSKEHIINASKLVDFSIAERLKYCDITDGNKGDAELLIEWLVKRAKLHKKASFGYSEIQSNISPKTLRQKAVFELAIDYLLEKQHIRLAYQDDCRFIEINPKLLTA